MVAGQGYEADTKSIAHEPDDVVNPKPLHHFASMAFDRLGTEPEPIRDRASPMSFGDQPEHLYLTPGKLV